MKTSKPSITIPEPCHENWENMLPDEKGRFCLSCSKSVHDFTGKTDLEIHRILMTHKGQKVCGRFSKSQLNRPLNIRINLADLPKNISTTRSFAIAVFLVFGSLLISCTDSFGQKMGEVEVVRPNKTNTNTQTPATQKKTLPPDSLRINEEPIKGDVKWEVPVMGKMEYVEPDSLEKIPDSTEVVPHIDPPYMGGVRYVVDPTEILKDSSVVLNEPDITTIPLVEDENDFLIYPNPGRGEFRFTYSLKRPADIRLEIYNEKGQIVKLLVDVKQQYAGQYTIPASLEDLSPGVYFAILHEDGKRITKKIVVGE